jgi:hypothetical protein
MWKLLHVVLCEAAELPVLDPRPRPNVGDGELAMALASKKVLWYARVLARKLNLEDAKDSERLLAKAIDCDWSRLATSTSESKARRLTWALLLCAPKEAEVSLVRSAAAVPKKEPLQHFTLPLRIAESKVVLLVQLQQIQQLGRRLHDCKGWIPSRVNDNWYAAWQSQLLARRFEWDTCHSD